MTLLRDDTALQAAFRRGQRTALERVYWHYVDAVATVLRQGATTSQGTRVLAASPEDRVDLLQETFLRAFKDSARLAYDGRRPYQPYLMMICRNVLVDWTRRFLRERVRRDQASEAEPVDISPVNNTPWADPQTMRAVEAYIAQLDGKQRAVYEARYVQGLSQVDTAKQLSMTRQQVRTVENALRAGLAAWLS